jgi:hypothetical protein
LTNERLDFDGGYTKMRFPRIVVLIFAATSAFAAATNEKGFHVLDRFRIGGSGGWDYLAADSGRLYISRGDHVIVVNAADGKLLATIADTAGVHSVVPVPSLKRGFTSNGRANTITEFDLGDMHTLRTFTIAGQNPDAMLYDTYSKHLFTFNGRSHDATVVDPADGKTVATIALGGKPEFAASDGKGNIFVNIEDTAELTRIDAAKNTAAATWKLADCEEPTGLALDIANARLFSVCQNGKMSITDAHDGHHVASVAIGSGPDAAAFDSARGLVFSSNGSDGTLTVVHQDSADAYRVVASVPTQKSARTMALDAHTHRVYLVGAEFGPEPAADPKQPHQRPPVVEGSFTIIAVGE